MAFSIIPRFQKIGRGRPVGPSLPGKVFNTYQRGISEAVGSIDLLTLTQPVPSLSRLQAQRSQDSVFLVGLGAGIRLRAGIIILALLSVIFVVIVIGRCVVFALTTLSSLNR